MEQYEIIFLGENHVQEISVEKEGKFRTWRRTIPGTRNLMFKTCYKASSEQDSCIPPRLDSTWEDLDSLVSKLHKLPRDSGWVLVILEKPFWLSMKVSVIRRLPWTLKGYEDSLKKMSILIFCDEKHTSLSSTNFPKGKLPTAKLLVPTMIP